MTKNKQIKNNMDEKDIELLKGWLVDHGYYVGNSEVAKSLHEIADYWDD